MKVTEHAEQVAFFNWCDLQAGAFPELRYAFAIPNAGKRSRRQGARMVREGLRAGVPDIFIPAARHGYHGLFIELKVGPNQPTQKQEYYLDGLTDCGYLAVACWGADDAIDTVKKYMGGEL